MTDWNEEIYSPMESCEHCTATVYPDQIFDGMNLCDYCIDQLKEKRQELLDIVNRDK